MPQIKRCSFDTHPLQAWVGTCGVSYCDSCLHLLLSSSPTQFSASTTATNTSCWSSAWQTTNPTNLPNQWTNQPGLQNNPKHLRFEASIPISKLNPSFVRQLYQSNNQPRVGSGLLLDRYLPGWVVHIICFNSGSRPELQLCREFGYWMQRK